MSAREQTPRSSIAQTNNVVSSRLIRLLVAVSPLVCTTCTYELTATQVTLRIYATPEVKQQLAKLVVRVHSERAQPPERTIGTFGVGDITAWPVDVQVVAPPRDNDTADPFEAIVEVEDSSGTTLVQQRARTAYVPYEQRVIELWLRRCGDLPLGQLCESDPGCHGAQCLTCVDGACGSTPFIEALEPLDPADILDPNKLPPWDDQGPAVGVVMDGGVPPIDGGVSETDAAPGIVPPRDGGCNDRWLPVVAHGRIPPGTPSYADLEIRGEGHRLQYICRAPAPDKAYAPGKVNGFADAGVFDYGCYYGFFDNMKERWDSRGADQQGAMFEVFAPPPSCKLEWEKSGFNQVPPASALMMTTDVRGWPVFACRVKVDDAITVGTHIGRVTGGAGFDRCVVQYFDQKPMLHENFEVLVQRSPALRP